MYKVISTFNMSQPEDASVLFAVSSQQLSEDMGSCEPACKRFSPRPLRLCALCVEYHAYRVV